MKIWEYWGVSRWIIGSAGQHYKMKFQHFQHWDRCWSQRLNVKGDYYEEENTGLWLRYAKNCYNAPVYKLSAHTPHIFYSLILQMNQFSTYQLSLWGPTCTPHVHSSLLYQVVWAHCCHVPQGLLHEQGATSRCLCNHALSSSEVVSRRETLFTSTSILAFF